MQTTNVAEITSERAPVDTGVIIKLGLDVHAAQITVCRQIGGLLPQPAQQMSWERVIGLVKELVRAGAKIFSCYEAGPCGYGLHRQLTALGVTNYVVAPQRWDERGRRVKTDKRDARELCNRLDRYVRGNEDAFSVVRVPTVEQERTRALTRQRGAVLKERQRCVVRGHGLMLAQGIRAPEGWWQPRIWSEFAQQIPVWLRTHVQWWQSQAVRLDSQVRVLTKQVEELVKEQDIPKGLGALTAAVIEAEIFDWGRFTNRREISSYTGLCPSEDSSGSRRRQGSVSKYGNRRIRHQLVEAVWRLITWQPDYPPVAKIREASGARARKRATVAAARRLAVDLWRIKTGQCPPEKLGLKISRAR